MTRPECPANPLRLCPCWPLTQRGQTLLRLGQTPTPHPTPAQAKPPATNARWPPAPAMAPLASAKAATAAPCAAQQHRPAYPPPVAPATTSPPHPFPPLCQAANLPHPWLCPRLRPPPVPLAATIAATGATATPTPQPALATATPWQVAMARRHRAKQMRGAMRHPTPPSTQHHRPKLPPTTVPAAATPTALWTTHCPPLPIPAWPPPPHRHPAETTKYSLNSTPAAAPRRCCKGNPCSKTPSFTASVPAGRPR